MAFLRNALIGKIKIKERLRTETRAARRPYEDRGHGRSVIQTVKVFRLSNIVA